MGIHIDTRTFKSGNSVAVRLPRELGFEADVAVRLEKVGRNIHVKPLLDPVEEKRRLHRMVERLRAIGPPDPSGPREPIEFPDRPGLYD
ncbi:AbrB/MazE/SpoVT family DNA-binding domain-containing protein [Sphingomonas sp.]|jgi:antitoxin VapB|uniref:AbrB/MazE/SpoVT family DNA-binding domain-containing protein n=1 Tax=Sphingomonas sp. TaxID=28214 RepID=UPI002D7F9B75|nr:AbrB/MazE/SpoVT family DNA-binding domain-containing protein [Sphingomonas sp.]HEU0043608.1 AbrB/MazE/SpoVT family DNA-binding domain-containing protein [Sphingomonas sp.]